MIISTAIQNIPAKVWRDYFVVVNHFSCQHFSFSDWIKNIVPAVKMRDTAYLRNHKESYFDYMPYVWKNITVIKQRELMSIIYRFYAETPHGESPRTKKYFCLSFTFLPLTKRPR